MGSLGACAWCHWTECNRLSRCTLFGAVPHAEEYVPTSGYGVHCREWEHQPQPSSSAQPQTVLTSAHVSTHFRRHDERQVLCVAGHSRQVVVHLLEGSHVLVEEHQPQPGANSVQVHTSVAFWHVLADEMFREACTAPSKTRCNMVSRLKTGKTGPGRASSSQRPA